MHDSERACCPMCGAGLPLLTRRVGPFVVPDGAREAPYSGPGEVTRHSRPYAATVRGRREVVQDLWVWQGGYDAAWAPFCTTTCAARFGVSAFHRVRAGTLQSDAMREALPAPAEPRGRSLAARYGMLLESAAGDEHQAPALPEPAPELPEHWQRAARRFAEGTPGHPLWHPPGSPPPVPGEFRYDSGGYRIPDTPESRAKKQAAAAAARAARWPETQPSKRQAGAVNGHHQGPRA
jgi:hypothetical protein